MTLADSSRFWMQGPRPLPGNGARGAHCGARHKAKARAVFDLRAPKCNLARAFICLRALMFLWRAPPAPWRVIYVLLTLLLFFFLAQGRGAIELPHRTCQLCLKVFNRPCQLLAHSCRSPRAHKRAHTAPGSDSGASVASSRGEESPVRCISLADSAGEEEDEPDAQLEEQQEQPQAVCGSTAAGPAEEHPGTSSPLPACGFSVEARAIHLKAHAFFRWRVLWWRVPF